MSVEVRRLRPEELDLVNAWYAAIDFQPSTLERDRVWLALVDDVPAGAGRLVRVGEHDEELGGMLVQPSFRGRGLAARLVEEMMRQRRPGCRLYCLPFAHLSSFYERFGLRPSAPGDPVPAPIAEKLSWCGQTYGQPTRLLWMPA